MNFNRRKAFVTSLILTSGLAAATTPSILVGAYDVAQMKAMKGLTFPRVLLYGMAGNLIPQDSWPSTLGELKRAAGDAFCCVSEKPAPPGWKGQPPDCKVVVYGEKVEGHFVGLKTKDGSSIRYAALPVHEFLIVEYYASWCAPCLPARKALEAYLATPAARNTVALVVDFTKLAPGK